MKRLTLANRLSIRIMAVMVGISAIIMAAVYAITKDTMAREAESRYESIILQLTKREDKGVSVAT